VTSNFSTQTLASEEEEEEEEEEEKSAEINFA